MIDNTWYMEIDDLVLTKLKYEIELSLKEEYPDINVSNQLETREDAKFPTVLVKTLPSTEVGADTEGETINAILSGYQITVTTDTTQSDANLVMGYVINVMKSMKYQINQMPELEVSGDKKISIMRCNRVIGSDDAL